MGNCCLIPNTTMAAFGISRPGRVISLTAIQDAAAGSVQLQWLPPTENADQITGYDIRFRPVEAAHDHSTYVPTIEDPRHLRVTLKQSDGLPPLTQCICEVRAKINENGGEWCSVIQYVEWTCRLPDCFKSRLRVSPEHLSPFCCRDHAKQCAMEYCLYYECKETKTRQNGPQYHFCGPLHLKMAKLRNVSALLEMNGPNNKFKDLCKLFSKKWAKGSSPVIRSTLQVVNPSVENRFAAYVDTLPRRYRRVEQYFHGASISCNILDQLLICSNDSPRSLEECETCRTVENGFEMRNIIDPCWQRHGPGFYLTSKSSKAGEYCRGNGSSRAMFLCDVAPGRKYELSTSNPGLTAPPSGYHSVYGKSKFLGTSSGDLNCDEIVLYSADAICPRYLFIFHVNTS